MRTRGQFLGLREIGTQRPLAEHHLGLLTAVGLQARSAPPLRYLRDLVAEAFELAMRSAAAVVEIFRG